MPRRDYILLQQGIRNPPDSAIRKSIASDELSRHSRRRTCGTQETAKAIEDLLLQQQMHLVFLCSGTYISHLSSVVVLCIQSANGYNLG